MLVRRAGGEQMGVYMQRLVKAALAGAIIGTATPALASNPPTLHGFCSTTSACSDNGNNTPTSVNPPVFGFSAGGHDETGTVWIDILVPDNIANPSSLSFTLSGTLVGSNTYTASLFDANGAQPGTPAWTSGQLDTYLGISASPTNSIGSFNTTSSYNGFYVYRADIGSVTLPSNSDASNSSLLQLSQGLASGSYIVAFLDQGGSYGATANSGAIFETGTPPPSVPEPATWAMMLVGFGAAGCAMRRTKRANRYITQIA